jgi:hypothetical protein
VSRLNLGGGGFRRALHRGQKLHHYVGQFETDGDAAAVNGKGFGFSVAFLGTGQYRITLDRAFAELLYVGVALGQPSSGAGAVIAIPSTFTPGDMDTPASFVVETHSALGTEANLNGPVVMFEVWASDIATPHTVEMTDAT